MTTKLKDLTTASNRDLEARLIALEQKFELFIECVDELNDTLMEAVGMLEPDTEEDININQIAITLPSIDQALVYEEVTGIVAPDDVREHLQEVIRVLYLNYETQLCQIKVTHRLKQTTNKFEAVFDELAGRTSLEVISSRPENEFAIFLYQKDGEQTLTGKIFDFRTGQYLREYQTKHTIKELETNGIRTTIRPQAEKLGIDFYFLKTTGSKLDPESVAEHYFDKFSAEKTFEGTTATDLQGKYEKGRIRRLNTVKLSAMWSNERRKSDPDQHPEVDNDRIKSPWYLEYDFEENPYADVGGVENIDPLRLYAAIPLLKENRRIRGLLPPPNLNNTEIFETLQDTYPTYHVTETVLPQETNF